MDGTKRGPELPGGRGRRLALWVYKVSLRVLPMDLRGPFGEEMVALLEARMVTAKTRLGSGRIWLMATVDVLVQAFQDRLTRRKGSPGSPSDMERTVKKGFPAMGWEELRRNLVLAFRTLRRAPLYGVVVLLTLGVGIALNTVVFSVMNPFLLRPLPYTDGERIVHLGGVDPISGWDMGRFSAPQIADIERRTRALSGVAGYYYGSVNLSGDRAAEKVTATWGTGNLFPLLGITPSRGRALLPEDDLTHAEDVVVLSHGLWARRYGSDPEIVGGDVRIDGVPHTVVGVLPPEFNFPFNAVQLWLPMRADPLVEDRDDMGTLAIGRMADGWTSEATREELNSIQLELAALYPDADGRYEAITVKPLREALNFAWDILQPAFLILLVGVSFVLVIACVNVTSLTLARLSARRREVALRQAMGAGRGRLVLHFLVEALVLAVGGGVLGIALAYLGTGVLANLIPPDIYRVGEISLDGRVLAFSTVVTLATPAFFALMPALAASRKDLTGALKEGTAGGGTSSESLRGRRLLVVAEVALAVILVVGTGLMVRSLSNALETDVGFPAEHILIAELDPGDAMAQDATALNAKFTEIADVLSGLPGVSGVGTASRIPLNHETSSLGYGKPESLGTDPGEWPRAYWSRVGPTYFDAMGIDLIAGRNFRVEDAASEAGGVLISQGVAKRLWPGENAVGRIMAYAGSQEPRTATVLGVVGDIRYDGLDGAPRPQIYLPLLGTNATRRFVAISTAAGTTPAEMVEPVRAALFAHDPDLPASLRPMMDIVRESTGLWAISSIFLGIFAVFALGLAALGIYGLIAFSVTQRQQEMGIRMALGAHPRRLIGQVVSEGVKLAAVGLVIGGLGALGTGVLLSSLLLGVGGMDPLTLSATAATFLVVSTLSALIPALRAADANAVQVMRAE